MTVSRIYLMNFSHFHSALYPDSPLTPPLSLSIPRHPLLLSCLLFVCGPLIIRVPCLRVGGKLLSRTRPIYLCLFSARVCVCVLFTVKSLIFPRMPRILQAMMSIWWTNKLDYKACNSRSSDDKTLFRSWTHQWTWNHKM